MDPFTFGIVFTAGSGLVVTGLALLEKSDFPINDTAIQIFMETTKYGAILWLLRKFWIVFF